MSKPFDKLTKILYDFGEGKYQTTGNQTPVDTAMHKIQQNYHLVPKDCIVFTYNPNSRYYEVLIP